MPRLKIGPTLETYIYGTPVDPTTTTDADVVFGPRPISLINDVVTVDLTIPPYDPTKQVAPSRIHAVFSTNPPGDDLQSFVDSSDNFRSVATFVPDPRNGTKIYIPVPSLPPLNTYRYTTVLEYAS